MTTPYTNEQEVEYLSLLSTILYTGEDRQDRTGVGTLSTFGTRLEFDLGKGFPLLTTKRVFFKGVIEELLFFLRGEHDTTKLEAQGVNIWKGNTSREFLDSRNMTDYPTGSLGKGYGVQWRHWGGELGSDQKFHGGVDQLTNLLNTIKTNPTDRRLLVSAYNVAELNEMALPPCHYAFQCYVREDTFLDLMWHQRSVDCFLGLPFNIASYAALVHILARATNLLPGKLVFTGGDTHIYKTHIGAVKEQLSRDARPFPKLELTKELAAIQDIEALQFADFKLVGYNPYPTIKAEMAV
jgi:thymidylate synthase